MDAPSGKLAGETTVAVTVGVVYLPPGLFDVEAERARLTKERAALDADLVRVRGKLGNDGFVAKAPPEVVAGEREKASRMAQRLAEIDAQLAELG